MVEGLFFFLDNLGEERAFEILAEQALLPQPAGIEQRLVAIARHCPALHKLGQVLARDRRLPDLLRRPLQTLETMPSQLDVCEARHLVEAEVGPLADLGVVMDEPPLAEASVAVVLPFTARGSDGETIRGVFKLLKPGIEAKMAEELDVLQRIGALLDERCEALALPPIAYEESFVEVRALLAREVLLDHEQAHLAAARRSYAALRSVVVPEVYPYSTPRLTAMQRIDGIKVTDSKALTAAARRKLADLVVKALVAHPLWSMGDPAVFHADPHAGNLFVTAEGQLAILDWSLVGELSKDDRICLTQILVGALTLDGARMRHAIETLAQDEGDDAELEGIVEAHVDALRNGAWPGLSWLMGVMDDVATHACYRFGGDLVMFRKVLQTLDGVINDVSADSRPDRVLTVALLRQLIAEMSGRSIALPVSRHFASHLSNLDLTQLLASAPLIGSRQLIGLRAELLGSSD